MMATDTIFRPVLEQFSIKNPRLQYVFNHAKADLEKSFLDLKKTVEDTQFKHEIMIAFWLAIHIGELDIAQLIINGPVGPDGKSKAFDPIVDDIIQNLRANSK